MVLDSEGPCSSASRSPANAATCKSSRTSATARPVPRRASSPISAWADELAASGALASLIASGAKLTDQVLLINALDEDAKGALSVAAKRIGGPLLFGRIWERLGIDAVLADLLMERAFEFPVERAVFVAALHRLFVSGSDRDLRLAYQGGHDIPGGGGARLASLLPRHGLARRGAGGEAGWGAGRCAASRT